MSRAKRPAAAASENAFVGRADAPGEADVATALGPSFEHWTRIRDALATRHGVDRAEWRCYSKKAGWALRLLRKDRAIVYLSPRRGGFLAAFALGEKAVATALAGKFPAKIRKILRDAPRYPEGAAVRFDVSTAADADVVERLAAVKIAH